MEINLDNDKNFDLEKVYDEQIAPLMTKIIEICKEHKLPMAAHFQIQHEDGANNHCTTAVLPKERPVSGDLEAIYDIIKPKRRIPPLNLTVRDKDGNITQMITVIP